MKTLFAIGLIALLLGLSACDSGVSSPRGFSLPKGEIAKGQTVFEKYQCLSCHELTGFSTDEIPAIMEKRIKIGGPKTQVTTYAFLVTSVINPSHKIGIRSATATDEEGNSKMPNLNDEMTVSELIDLVTFLETKYSIKPYEYTPYSYYPMN